MRLEDFSARTFDTVRFGDTDRQGHVNNAVFATYFETGRVSVIHDAGQPLRRPGFMFVVAKITIEFKEELFWPGRIDIGTGIKSVGTSSMTFAQALFQNGKLAAAAESVVVQLDAASRRPAPLDDAARARLGSLTLR